MKNIKLILWFVISLCACAFIGCAENEDLTGETEIIKTIDIGLEILKADLIQTKSGSLLTDDEIDASDNIPYCDDNLTLGGVAVAQYSVTFISENGDRALDVGVWAWSVDDIDGGGDGLARLSELKQLDFMEGETSAIISIEDFRVYDSMVDNMAVDPALFKYDIASNSIYYDNAVTPEINFITPISESAYSGYVNTPVSKSFEVDLYEKQYIQMEVLCFDKETIPLFGFTWADFEIVTGDEICMFFNCLGSSAKDYHQVLPVEVTAEFWNGEEWADYWVGQNYSYNDDDEAELSVTPFSIPCPGNWTGDHGELVDGVAIGGFRVNIRPKDRSGSFDISISKDQIKAFLDGDVSFEEWTMSGDIGVGVIDQSNEVPFIHYVLDQCYTAQVYLSDLRADNGRSSDVYALTWTGTPLTDFKMTKLFSAEDYCHIAVTPDNSKLILAQEKGSSWGADFSIYDVYTLERTDLSFIEPTDGRSAMDYRFTQLVYYKDQLYGGCMSMDCLVPINIDFESSSFTYGLDIIDSDGSGIIENISGGDLIAGEYNNSTALYSMTKDNQGYVIKYWGVNEEFVSETQVTTNTSLNKLTGACMLSDSKSALTSHDDETVMLRYWTLEASSPYDISIGISGSQGGDMASPYYTFDDSTFDELFDIVLL